MFYRLRRKLETSRFDHEIAGILQTKPLDICDAPWTIVSMVANRDVPMYLAAVKSFYMRIGSGKIVAIIDRDMPQSLRDILLHHLPGIEFVILEEIPTDPCQRGGTWERLLYCLDRSASEYTIQLDSDTLTVTDVPEVLECLQHNRAFTMADGFTRVSLAEAADQAQSTPQNKYVGIVAESTFSRYEGGDELHYIRGSSGFAGFSKGGFTRTRMEDFHEKMEKLVGKAKWREWGSEQCGSNFAIANSPDPLVLPYPEYASFDHHVPRATAKFYHFIGRYRFAEGYFARRAQEVIAELTPGAKKIDPPKESLQRKPDGSAAHFAATLTTRSAVRHGVASITRRTQPLELEVRGQTKSQRYPGPPPKFRLPTDQGRRGALQSARDVFVSRIYASPVWLPEQRVKNVVDIGAGVGFSCLWWLSIYWRTVVTAFEEDATFANEIRSNANLNGYDRRLTLHPLVKGADDATRSREILRALNGQLIDILKIDLPGGDCDMLNMPEFGALNVRGLVVRWQETKSSARPARDACLARLNELGFRTYPTVESDAWGVIWGYKLP